MDKVFGIPISSIMTVLLALLAICLISIAWVAWRRPVLFKIGIRNIPRRKAQSALIVVGLMLSTLIIAASLGTGDTLSYSLTSDISRNFGHVDQLVVPSQTFDGPAVETTGTFDDSALQIVDDAVRNNPDIDGVMPYLSAFVPAQNLTKNQAEPEVIVMGIDPARLEQFGGLKSTDGDSIDLGALKPGEAVIGESAVEALDGSVGDTFRFTYQGESHEVTVVGIAEDTFLSGYQRGREDYLEQGGMVMPLSALQDLTGEQGQLTGIAISNTGGVDDGYALTDSTLDALRGPLTGTGLGVDTIKKTANENGEDIASVFTSIFLILGLFTILSGILLIVLIFTMLAAERRSEMGIARAVGTQRKQLMQQFVSEGSAYALLAGLVGAGLGVVAAVGIALSMKQLFGQYVPIEPHVTSQSLIIAYSLGVVITFITVVVSSWKISKLNVVAAIRDLPDHSLAHRTKRALLWGVLLVAAGGLLALVGHDGGKASLFLTGLSLIPFGVAQILRFFGVPARPVYTLVGLALLVLWLIPEETGEKIWGDMDSSIEIFFLAGIFMVVGATMVIVQNSDVLLRGVSKLGGLFGSKLPAVRTAVAYPGSALGRTGMTIAMFSLVVFSLVMMATMSENYNALYSSDKANAGWDVRADANNANAIADFTGSLKAAGVDTSEFEAVGVTTNPSRGSSQVRLAGQEEWKQWPVKGMDSAFLDSTILEFGNRAKGYESDAAIVEALRTEPNVAVVDFNALPSDDFGGDDTAFSLDGLSSGDTVFDPVTAELAASDGSVHQVKIIGIIDEEVTALSGLYAAQSTIDSIYPTLATTSYYVALADKEQADRVAKSIEAALLENGVQGVSIYDELQDMQQQDRGFLYLIEGFMGLGLLVGVAAIGVIAFRSVVERRQEIGVLRAIGFQRGLVSLSFLIETAFVVGLGVIAGTILGVILSYNLFTSDETGSSGAAFSVPWPIITAILLATVAVALVMTWIPSRQASRIAPAEALRYE